MIGMKTKMKGRIRPTIVIIPPKRPGASSGGRDGFLRSAEKALEQVRKTDPGNSKNTAPDDFSRIREEIYGYKFGRGTISAADMKRILREIEDLKTAK